MGEAAGLAARHGNLECGLVINLSNPGADQRHKRRRRIAGAKPQGMQVKGHAFGQNLPQFGPGETPPARGSPDRPGRAAAPECGQ